MVPSGCFLSLCVLETLDTSNNFPFIRTLGWRRKSNPDLSLQNLTFCPRRHCEEMTKNADRQMLPRDGPTILDFQHTDWLVFRTCTKTCWKRDTAFLRFSPRIGADRDMRFQNHHSLQFSDVRWELQQARPALKKRNVKTKLQIKAPFFSNNKNFDERSADETRQPTFWQKSGLA